MSEFENDVGVGSEITATNHPDRTDRILNSSEGDIVAANADGKVISAAIVKRYDEQKILVLMTSYGREFEVGYKDVLWVKTPGHNWPSGVYKLFKENELNSI